MPSLLEYIDSFCETAINEYIEENSKVKGFIGTTGYNRALYYENQFSTQFSRFQGQDLFNAKMNFIKSFLDGSTSDRTLKGGNLNPNSLRTFLSMSLYWGIFNFCLDLEKNDSLLQIFNLEHFNAWRSQSERSGRMIKRMHTSSTECMSQDSRSSVNLSYEVWHQFVDMTQRNMTPQMLKDFVIHDLNILMHVINNMRGANNDFFECDVDNITLTTAGTHEGSRGFSTPQSEARASSSTSVRGIDKFRDKALLVKSMVTTRNSQGLAKQYWLEKLDPQHRTKEYLAKEHEKWKSSNTSFNFFTWLDVQERVSETVSHKVHYYDSAELSFFEISFRSGQLIQGEDELYSTLDFVGKKPQHGLYVYCKNNKLYSTEHVSNFIQHSSIMSGEHVVAAGMIKVHEGKIIYIDNKSGHYQTGIQGLYRTLCVIPQSCFQTGREPGVVQYTTEPWLKDFSGAMATSSYKIARKIGRSMLSKAVTTYRLDYNQFMLFAQEALKKRDIRKNRNRIVLYESVLSREIIENGVGMILVNREINPKIYNEIMGLHSSLAAQEQRLLERNILSNANIPSSNSSQFSEQLSEYLNIDDGESYYQVLLFHKYFFEEIYPSIHSDHADSLERPDNLFNSENRGRVKNSRYNTRKASLYWDRDYGIAEKSQTTENYFDSTQMQAKNYFDFADDRQAVVNREELAEVPVDEAYRTEVVRYDIPFIAGPSGTASYISGRLLLPPYNLSPGQLKLYLAALSSTEVLCGHHSYFEVLKVGYIPLRETLTYSLDLYRKYVCYAFDSEQYDAFLNKFADAARQSDRDPGSASTI